MRWELMMKRPPPLPSWFEPATQWSVGQHFTLWSTVPAHVYTCKWWVGQHFTLSTAVPAHMYTCKWILRRVTVCIKHMNPANIIWSESVFCLYLSDPFHLWSVLSFYIQFDVFQENVALCFYLCVPPFTKLIKMPKIKFCPLIYNVHYAIIIMLLHEILCCYFECSTINYIYFTVCFIRILYIHNYCKSRLHLGPNLILFCKNCEYTLLGDVCVLVHVHKVYPDLDRSAIIYPGHNGQLAPHCRALGTMIKNLYPGIKKTLNTSLDLGGGGDHNLRPGCRHHLAGTFHTPARCLQVCHHWDCGLGKVQVSTCPNPMNEY